MEQVIVTHIDNTTLKLQSKQNVSKITQLKQTVDLNGVDTIDITIESANKLALLIGDKITIIGRSYTLNTPAKETKLAENHFVYDLQFEGIQYDLLRASYNVNVDTTNNQVQDINGSSLTGDLKMFLDVLISNANRVFPGKWSLGTYPLTTETRTETFGDTDNCLSVLQTLCGQGKYNTNFKITIDEAGNRTLNVGVTGTTLAYTFEYGRGKGLYELNREKLSNSNIITRLYAYGSSKNINTTKYRADRLCLATKSKSQSYIQDAAAVAKYGIWEAVKIFEDVFPHREGTISALGANELKFIDASMDFDLNEKDGSGNTLYLLPGQSAKIHFNSGNLAGYDFEVTAYDNATKQFTLKAFTDQNGYVFPSPSAAAFKFGIGDKYVITDIYMPLTYIDNAETELGTKGSDYYSLYCQPQVQYGLKIDWYFLKNIVGAEAESNIIWPGDLIPIKDTDLDVDKTIKVKGFTRDLLKDYSYDITVSDLPVQVSIINRIVADLNKTDKVLSINNLVDPARARRNYKATMELETMIEIVKAEAVLVGNDPAAQYSLSGVAIKPNYNGNANTIDLTAGTIAHNYYPAGNPGTWNISAGNFASLTPATAYYIYIKASKSAATAVYFVSSTKIEVESVAGYYHFPLAVLSSVIDGARVVTTTKGYTLITGDGIKTGRISSNDGQTYFDLNTGEFKGTFKFASGASVETAVGTAQSTADSALSSAQSSQNYINSVLPGQITNLQNQIDGQVLSWFKEYDPAISNLPASEWTTDALKQQHANDTFTNTLTGACWRWQQSGGVWGWGIISDTATQQALTAAGHAQDTADGKRRVFVAQPVPPYDLGDLWSQGSAGELMKCIVARASGAYVAADWEKAAKYTDDTAVNNLQIGGRNLFRNGDYSNGLLNVGGGFGSGTIREIVTDSQFGHALKVTDNTRLGSVVNSGVKAGTPMIISFYAKATSETAIMLAGIGYDSGTPTGICTQSTGFSLLTTWKLFAYTFTASADLFDNEYIYFYLPTGDSNPIYFTRVKIEVGNKPTDWTPAPEDVDAKIAAAQAKAEEADYLKQAIQNNTTMQGGLLSTTIMRLGAVDQAGQWVEKAGINGAGTGDNTTRFYAGGTLADAIARIAGVLTGAKFVVTDGGKVFAREVELMGSFKTAATGARIELNHPSGSVIIYDANNVAKTIIASGAIPSLASLLANNSANVDATKSASAVANSSTPNATDNQYTANLVLPSDSTNYKITTPPIALFVEASDTGEGGNEVPRGAFASVSAFLVKPDLSEVFLGGVSVSVTGDPADTYNSQSLTIPSQVFNALPAGTYKINLYATASANNIYSGAQSSASIAAPDNTLSGVSLVNVSRIYQDGMFLITDATHYHYISPTSEIVKNDDIRGFGTLASAYVQSNGTLANYFNAVITTVDSLGNGLYTVNHSINNTFYVPDAIPVGDGNYTATVFNVVAGSFQVRTRNAGVGANLPFNVNISGAYRD